MRTRLSLRSILSMDNFLARAEPDIAFFAFALGLFEVSLIADLMIIFAFSPVFGRLIAFPVALVSIWPPSANVNERKKR